MIEQLHGIVIEVVTGDVMFDGEPVKRLQAECLEDLVAQAKAWINSNKEQYGEGDWGLRYR